MSTNAIPPPAPPIPPVPAATPVPDSLRTLAVRIRRRVHLVALVPWPAAADERAVHAAAGRPRILLVAPDASPPLTSDPDEDWVRLPVGLPELDVRARSLVASAAVASGAHDGAGDAPDGPPVPVLDADGVLRHDGRLAVVPPIEARILALLVHHRGRIVPRADLVRAGWPDGRGSDALLHDRVKHLRRRLRPLGLVVHTVRATGLLLEVGTGGGAPTSGF